MAVGRDCGVKDGDADVDADADDADANVAAAVFDFLFGGADTLVVAVLAAGVATAA